MSDKQKSPIAYTHDEVFTKLLLPEIQPDAYVSVVVVEYAEKPAVKNELVAKSITGGFSLTPKNQISTEQTILIQDKEQFGTVPEHVNLNRNISFRWKIYVDEPGEKQVDISYSFQSQTANSYLVIKVAASESKLAVKNTGKTVGEPNQNWIIDNFKSESAGKIYFPQAGFYELEMEAILANDEELKFQWIWIN